VLRLTPLDRELAGKLVARMREQAIEPLLDQLETTQDRPARAWLLGLLTGFGGAAAARAGARMPNAHWHLQRNLLVLLQRIGSGPAEFSPAEYLSHPEPAVRREALKLALRSHELRGAALVSGLGDTDSRVLVLALAAAGESCPTEAVAALEALARDRRRDPDVRARALRALGRTPSLHPGLALRRLAVVRWRDGIAMLRALSRSTPWSSVRAFAAARAKDT
jgi:hypothetical protein